MYHIDFEKDIGPTSNNPYILKIKLHITDEGFAKLMNQVIDEEKYMITLYDPTHILHATLSLNVLSPKIRPLDVVIDMLQTEAVMHFKATGRSSHNKSTQTFTYTESGLFKERKFQLPLNTEHLYEILINQEISISFKEEKDRDKTFQKLFKPLGNFISTYEKRYKTLIGKKEVLGNTHCS